MTNDFVLLISEKLGLSEKEAKVYSLFILYRILTLGEICHHTSFSPSEVDFILRSLKDKGLISQIPGIVEKYTVVTPFKALSNTIDEASRKIGNTKATLEEHFKGVKANLEGTTSSFQSKLKEILSDEIQALRGEMDKSSRIFKNLTKQEMNNLAGFVDTVKESLMKEIENYNRISEEEIVRVKGEIEGEINQLLDGVKKVTEESVTKIDGALTSTFAIIDGEFKEIKRRIASDFSKVIEATSVMKDKIAEKLRKTEGEFNLKIKENFEVAEDEASRFASLMRGELNKRAEFMSKTVSEHVQADIEEQKKRINKLEKSLDNFMITLTSDIAKSISSFYTSILRPVRSLGRNHEREVREFSERVNRLIDESTSRLITLIDDVKSKVAEHIREQVDSQGKILKDFGLIVDKRLTLGIKEFEEAFSSAKERFSSIVMEGTLASREVYGHVRSSVEAFILEHEDVSKNTLKKIEERIKSVLSAERETESKESSEFKAAFSSMLEVSKRELVELASLMTTNALKEVNATTISLISELKKVKESISDHIKKELEKLKLEVDEAKQGIMSLLDQRIAGMEGYAKQARRHLESIIRDRLDEMAVNVEAIRSGFVDAMNTILIKLNSLIEEAKNSFSLSLSSQLSFFRENLDKLVYMFASELEQQVSLAKAEANELLSKFSEELEERILEVESTVMQAIKTTEDIFKKQERISRQFRDLISSLLVQEARRYIDSFSSTSLSLRERLSSIIEAREKSLKRIREKMEKEISDIIISEEGLMKEKYSTLMSAIDNQLSERIEKYIEALNNTAKEIEKVLSEHAEQYKVSLEELLKELSNTLEKTLEKMTQTSIMIGNESATRLDEEKDIIFSESKILAKHADKIVSRYIENLKIRSVNVLNELLKQISEKIENMKNKQESLKISLKGIVEEDVREFEEMIRGLEGKIISNLNSEKEEISHTISQLELKLLELLGKVKEEAYAHFEAVGEEVTAILNQFSREAVDVLKVTSDEINRHLEESGYTFGGKIEGIRDTINQLIKELSNELMDGASKTYKKVFELIKKHHEMMERGMQEAQKQIMEELKAQTEKQEEEILEFSKTFMEGISHLTEKYETALSDAVNSILFYLNDFYKEIADRLEGAVEVISKSLKEVIEQSENVKNFAQMAWEELEKAPSSMDKTCFIATKEAVLARIKDMITRTKKSLLIVAPTLNEIPVDALLEFKSHARAYVFTSFSLTDDFNILSKLISRGNIRLWMRKEKDFFMCLRDDEEILIAPISETTPILAIVSEEKSYINAYKQTLIPLLREASKEIKPKDLEKAT